MTIERPPVIGVFVPWTGRHFQTKFKRFDNGKIHGLAYVDDDVIEFLAVAAHRPGTGQFRDFIAELKAHYKSIRFWAMLNDSLTTTLLRYGFQIGIDLDEYGSHTNCMDWWKKMDFGEKQP